MTRLPAIVPLCLGLLIGGFAVTVISGDPAPSPQVVAAPQEQPTMVVEVNAILQLPTGTVTPLATLEPTPYTKRITINECGTATPGATCEWPNPTPMPPTPYPLCGPEMRGGMTCVWPTETAT